MFLKLIRITETIALASLLLLICAPNLALCLRFASALWPERHKSYTAVFGARDESENECVIRKACGPRLLMLYEL